MARFKFVVLTKATGDRNDEFNEWYDAVHMPDVLAVDGVVGGERFRVPTGADPTSPFPFLTIYEWEADTIEEAQAALAEANASGALPLHEVLDIENTRAWFYESMSPSDSPDR